MLLAWSLSGTALGALIRTSNSTDTVFEDYVPDPFRTRVFAVAASSTLERVGFALLLGAATTASGVLGAGIAERRGLRLQLVPSVFGLAAAALVALATRDTLTAGAFVVVAAVCALPLGERRASAILCAGAALAASVGAWSAQAGRALNPFARVGAEQAPNLADVLSSWPHVAFYVGASLLLCAALAVKFNRALPDAQSSLVAMGTSLGLVFPCAGLAGFSVAALDARATCQRANDPRLEAALVLPGPAAIGECVPHNVIRVSKAALQLEEMNVEQGAQCQERFAEVLRQRFSEHFVLPTQDTTMGDLECVLWGLRNAESVRGLWQRSDPPWAIPAAAGTSSAFIAIGDQQVAPWPLRAWNRLPLRTNITLVEQPPQAATATLRLARDQWSWGVAGSIEQLVGSPEERLVAAKHKLATGPFVVFDVAADVPISVLLQLLRSAQQPLLLLAPKAALPKASPASEAADASRQPQLSNEVNERDTGSSSQALKTKIAVESKLLQGEISVPELDAALAVLPRRVGTCLQGEVHQEIRFLVRFFVQRYGDVVNVAFPEALDASIDQNCVRRVFERLRPPIPASAVARVETTLVVAPGGP